MRTTAQTVHLIAATAGFVSFFLLWLAVVYGMVLRNGWAQTRIRHATVYGIHQVMALLGLCLGVVHALVQITNPAGTIFLVHVLVPFIYPYDPIGIGVGVVGLELLLALAFSILIQRRLGYTRWRALHSFSYVAFMLIVAHILVSGTETGPVYVWGPVVGMWLVTVLMWINSLGAFARAGRKVKRTMAERQKAQELTVNVDASRCARFGFCEHEAPETFRLRSDGRLSYNAAVPLHQVEAVMRAVEVCPARAIALNQVPTKVFTPRPTDPPPPPEPLTGDALRDGSGRHRTVTGIRERRPARRRGRS